MKRNVITFGLLVIFCFVIQASVQNTRWGDNTVISEFANMQDTILGDNTRIYSYASIGEIALEGVTKEIVIIGDNTIVYPFALICRGVSIGNNCIINSYCLIKEDVPDSSEVYIKDNVQKIESR